MFVTAQPNKGLIGNICLGQFSDQHVYSLREIALFESFNGFKVFPERTMHNHYGIISRVGFGSKMLPFHSMFQLGPVRNSPARQVLIE